MPTPSKDPSATDFTPIAAVVPRVVALVAARRHREDLSQQVLLQCWCALRSGATIKSPYAYALQIARRIFARMLDQRLRFDSAFLSTQCAPEPIEDQPDLARLRGQVKRKLKGRMRIVYELVFERGLSIRATARTCRCDPKQVRRHIGGIRAIEPARPPASMVGELLAHADRGQSTSAMARGRPSKQSALAR